MVIQIIFRLIVMLNVTQVFGYYKLLKEVLLSYENVLSYKLKRRGVQA